MPLLTRRPGEEIVIIDKEAGEQMVIVVLRPEPAAGWRTIFQRRLRGGVHRG